MQYNTLYPNSGQVDQSVIDMTLWVVLARNITPDNQQYKWANEPHWDETQWQHDVIRIRLIRNRLFHRSGPQLTSDTYDNLRLELVHALKRLGCPDDVIDAHFARDLDAVETHRCVQQLREQVFDEMFQTAQVRDLTVGSMQSHNTCIFPLPGQEHALTTVIIKN